MTNVENTLLKQMQKLAAAMNAMQGAANKDKGAQNSVSFQEMLQKSEVKNPEKAVSSKELKKDKLTKDDGGPDAELEPVVRPKGGDGEELKAENLTANPNAVIMLDMIRPEIVETVEQTEEIVVLNPIPQEAVQETAMDLDGQMPGMETTVDTSVGAEVSMEQQPHDFQQSMEEAPRQEETVQTTEIRQEAPQRETVEQTERPDRVTEVHVETSQDDEEPTGEAMAAEQPVFHETHAVPVKVGERYESVDTQKPEMDDQVANTVHTAVETGQDRVEIHLAPQNLGSLVIEMTKDTNGVLQVVLHAATPKAEGLLNQHLSNLHTALQGYGHEEVRLEVQRGEESQQQHFRQADPDGRGNRHQQRQQERQEDRTGGEEFMQKLRLGLFGSEEL